MAVRKYTSYERKAQATVERPFECPAGCGYRGFVSVTETTSASVKVQGWNHSAAERQHQSIATEQKARGMAQATAIGRIRLAVCPRCGKRSTVNVVRHVVVHVVLTSVLLGATIFLGSAAFVGPAGLTFNAFPAVLAGMAALFLFAALVSGLLAPAEARKKCVFRDTPAPVEVPAPVPTVNPMGAYFVVGAPVWAMAPDGNWYQGKIAAMDPGGTSPLVVFPNGQTLICPVGHLRPA